MKKKKRKCPALTHSILTGKQFFPGFLHFSSRVHVQLCWNSLLCLSGWQRRCWGGDCAKVMVWNMNDRSFFKKINFIDIVKLLSFDFIIIFLVILSLFIILFYFVGNKFEMFNWLQIVFFSEQAKGLSLTITLFRHMSHTLNSVSRKKCPSRGSIASLVKTIVLNYL